MYHCRVFFDFDWSWFDFNVKASDRAIITSGACGSQTTYTLYDDGELIISGSGSTSDYLNISSDGYVTSKYRTKPWFNYSNQISSVTVEEGITHIGNGLFSEEDAHVYNIMNIKLPKSLVSFGAHAFTDCKFENIELPSKIEKISHYAFVRCDNLSEITIPEGVTEIGKYAFYSCSSLTQIVIPSTVKKIDDMAFNGCNKLTDVYYLGTEEQWKKINIYKDKYDVSNKLLEEVTIHYNYKLPQTSYFTVSSDQFSVYSIHRKETATYKINLLDENSDFLPIDDVTVQNNTTDIVSISTKKASDTEIELTVEPIKDGEASISLFNGDGSLEQFFNFTVYSNTTTYRADQVPVTNEKLKTNFSRGDLTVDNFEYIFDENKGKYVATMDVYNSSGAIGVVAAYTQDGKISEIEQVDPYIPLPDDFGEFLVYLGTGAVGILKGENWNYRYAGDSQKTSIEIEVPEDGYLTVSCDVTSDNATFMYNLVSLATDILFKTSDMIEVLAKVGGDTDDIAKKTKDTLAEKVYEYFNEDVEWKEKAISKITKKTAEQFSGASLAGLSMLSIELVEEMFQNSGNEFSKLILDVIGDIIKEEIKDFSVMAAAKSLIENEIIEAAEETLLKAASIMFDGGSYVNLVNSILGAYRYNVGTGKTDIVFKPKGEDGFLCKETVKVKSDIINKDVILNTYVVNYLELQDLFIRDVIDSDFNRDDGLDEKEMNIDLKRIVEIREISLYENGKEIDKTFKATVEIDKPANMNIRTCCVYRVEKDGTYTKLKTRIEGNKIVFETDHFSHYVLTGIRNDIEGTTPCDEHVYEEVRTEPSCTDAGSITYTCYCGDTNTETIEPTGHDFDGSKCTNCDYNKADDCSCNCHKGGIAGFFFKIILFFQKIFKTNQTCSCGVAHY